MERFGYKNLKALRKESTEILRLVATEQYGYKMDTQEELEEQKAETERMRNENGR